MPQVRNTHHCPCTGWFVSMNVFRLYSGSLSHHKLDPSHHLNDVLCQRQKARPVREHRAGYHAYNPLMQNNSAAVLYKQFGGALVTCSNRACLYFTNVLLKLEPHKHHHGNLAQAVAADLGILWAQRKPHHLIPILNIKSVCSPDCSPQ